MLLFSKTRGGGLPWRDCIVWGREFFVDGGEQDLFIRKKLGKGVVALKEDLLLAWVQEKRKDSVKAQGGEDPFGERILFACSSWKGKGGKSC